MSTEFEMSDISIAGIVDWHLYKNFSTIYKSGNVECSGTAWAARVIEEQTKGS